MSGDENFLQETAPLIHHARSLPDRPLERRLTPYRNVGQLLADRAASMPDKEWMIFCTDEGRSGSMTYAEFEDRARREIHRPPIILAALRPYQLLTRQLVPLVLAVEPRVGLVQCVAPVRRCEERVQSRMPHERHCITKS